MPHLIARKDFASSPIEQKFIVFEHFREDTVIIEPSRKSRNSFETVYDKIVNNTNFPS